MATDQNSPFSTDDVDVDVFSIIRRILTDCGWNDKKILSLVNLIASTNNLKDFKGTIPIFDAVNLEMYELGESGNLHRTTHSKEDCAVECPNIVQMVKSTSFGFELRKSKLNGDLLNWSAPTRSLIISAFSIKSRALFIKLLTSIYPAAFHNPIDLKLGDAFLAVANEVNRLMEFDDDSSKQKSFELALFYGIVHSNPKNIGQFDSYFLIRQRVKSIAKFTRSIANYRHCIQNHADILREWDSFRKSPISMLDADLIELILSFLPFYPEAKSLELAETAISAPNGLQKDLIKTTARNTAVELGYLSAETAHVGTILTNPQFRKVSHNKVGELWTIRQFGVSIGEIARVKRVCRAWNAPIDRLLPKLQVTKIGGKVELIRGNFKVRLSFKRAVKRRVGGVYEDGFDHFPAWFSVFISNKLEFTLGLIRGDDSVKLATVWKNDRQMMGYSSSLSGFVGRPISSSSIETRRVTKHPYWCGRDHNFMFAPMQMATHSTDLSSAQLGIEVSLKICETTKALSKLNGGNDEGVRIHVKCGQLTASTEQFKVLPRKRYDNPNVV